MLRPFASCGAIIAALVTMGTIAPGLRADEPVSDDLILRHDYFRGSGNDLTGNGRDAQVGMGAVQVPRHIWLNGGYYDSDSRVVIPVMGSDGKTLEQVVAAQGGDASIEIWFQGVELERGGYLLFDGRGNRPDEPDRGRGGASGRIEIPLGSVSASLVVFDPHGKEQDIINGASPYSLFAGKDISDRININHLHQYVYVFDGDPVTFQIEFCHDSIPRFCPQYCTSKCIR